MTGSARWNEVLKMFNEALSALNNEEYDPPESPDMLSVTLIITAHGNEATDEDELSAGGETRRSFPHLPAACV